MIIYLNDNNKRLDFAPLTLTRPVGNLRMGILTNDQRWKHLLPNAEILFDTEEYLSKKFPQEGKGITVNACVIPTQEVADAVAKLKPNQLLTIDGNWIARSGGGDVIVPFEGESPLIIEHRWELYQKNGAVLEADFEMITKNRTSEPISETNTIIGDRNLIFLEKGAKVEASILNTTTGPIYLGENAEIMEGSIVRGALAMGEESALKLGAKIYGPTTIGPHCKVGGEVNNSIFYAYSNKGHDGFVGNSVIGEWCNLGADTNTSNLKNNYGTVKTYSYSTNKLEQTNVQFMGLVMGDHSKTGINTMLNTASVVGVASNLFGADFPEKYISSFQWGTNGERFEFSKAIESINNMMSRRNMSLSDAEIEILKYISDNY